MCATYAGCGYGTNAFGVLRRCAQEIDTVGDTPVEEIMTRNVIVGQVTDTVDYVMSVMTENRIRHLPIVSDAGLVGMVSIGDVVQSQLRETKHERRHMKRYIQGTY